MSKGMSARRSTSIVAALAIFMLVGGPLAGMVRPAAAATGDFVHETTFSVDCSIGVGIAYDGQHLWYSCYYEGTIHRADPLTGVVDYSYSTGLSGIGAMAFDSARNAIWFDGGNGNVYLAQLDASKQVTSVALAFNHPEYSSLVDGLAYDGTDDTLYYSGDVQATIYHYKSDGTLLGSFSWAGNGCGNSGLAIGGNLLFEGSDGCTHVWVADKSSTSTIVYDFSTVALGDSSFRDEDLECDPNTFAASNQEVMWSKEAYSPMRAIAFEIQSGTCGSGGQPPQQDCNNVLLADAGVINLGQTTKLTQHLDTCNGLTGTMTQLKVTEPDGDVCVATGLPDAIPTPSGELTKTYPTDFTIDTANSNGDGACNTQNVGQYIAQSTVDVDGGAVKTTTATFETNFFVLPESPIGVAALMGSSLAVLGGFMVFSRKRRSSNGADNSSMLDSGLGV
jgi:hypothetical protein